MTISNPFVIKEFTGKHMLAVLFLFFGTIIAVNLTLTWFALDTWSGLVAKNGYVESVHFKDRQAEIEKQNELGWKSQVRLESGQVLFSVKDADGKAITDLTIAAIAGRVVTEKADFKLTFKEIRPGVYAARAPIQNGQWQIDIRSKNAKKQTYRKIYRIMVRTEKQEN